MFFKLLLKKSLVRNIDKIMMNIEVLNIPLPEDLMKLKWNGQFELLKEMIDLWIQFHRN